jgi:ketosteroid isomerase-like protein
MKSRILEVVSAIAIVAFTASIASSEPSKSLPPEIVDATHATKRSAAFFSSVFKAKSQHDVAATMKHFSTDTLTYVDATLGWPFLSHDALKGVFEQYMPKWPATALSYPTRILGDERSAVVAFTDTPELFGSEIRILAAVDFKDGKVVRWIDYWDGRHFGTALAAKLRTPADKFLTDLREASVPNNASARIRAAAGKLQTAFAGNDTKAAAALFSDDAVYEDMTLRAQVLGKLAIERYLGRALGKLPQGASSSLLHVVGSDLGGGFEWQAALAYRKTVRRGLTALALDREGKITRLTTVWDGAMASDAAIKALSALSLE